jgi:hypothetical protein
MLRIAKRADHRPADPREARKLVSELPSGDPVPSLEQIVVWIETLTGLPEVRLDRRFDSIGVFEEAATLLERRVARDYGRSGRLPAVREQRMWSAAHRLWHQLAVAYQLCMMEYDAGVSGAASLQLRAPVMGCHAMRGLRKEMKWVLLRHGRVDGRVWQEAARIYQVAHARAFARKEVTLHPGQAGRSTVERELVKMLLLAISSPESLPPLQLEIAAHLVSRCAEFVPLELDRNADATHIFDVAADQPPRRASPEDAGTSLRYLGSHGALPHLERISKDLAQQGAADGIAFGGYEPRMVREVAQHLTLYWSAKPPTRESERHPAMARVNVVPAFQGLLDALQGYVGGPFVDDVTESWVAENVSRGGYGAVISQVKGDWVRVGSLVAIKPESAPVWGVGVVRRMSRDETRKCRVGIESFSKAAIPVHLVAAGTPISANPSDHFPNAVVLGLNLKCSGEVDLVMEAGAFSSRLAVEMVVRGVVYSLTPVGFVEGGDDFDIARYRIEPREPSSPGML